MANRNLFLGSLLTGFSQARQAKRDREERDELKKLKVKAFKDQLELQEKQGQARQDLDLLVSDPGFEGTLIDALSTKKGLDLALDSGLINLKDVPGIQQQTRTSDLLSRLSDVGFGGGDFNTALTVGSGGPNISIRPTKKRFQEIGGKQQLVDEFGNIVGGGVEKPIPANQLKDFVNEEGENPKFGTTPSQLSAQGFTPKGDKITPEQGGKIQALVGARDIAGDLRTAISGAQGNDKRLLLTNMVFKTPGTEGRRLSLAMRDAADAVVRARTGATANETELKGILEQFLPSPFDNDATIEDKLNRFEAFVGGTLDIITLPESLRKKIDSKGGMTVGRFKVRQK